MNTLMEKEFTNRHGDNVKVTLMQDSFNAFHLIVKAKRLRVEEQHRVKDGAMVTHEKRIMTDETSHANIPDRTTAVVEFFCECYWNALPGYTNDHLQADIKREKGE